MELICLFFIRQLGSPGGSVVKNLPANTGGMGSIPGLGRSPEEGNGDPLQYAWLGNPVDRRAWQGYRSRGRKSWDATKPTRRDLTSRDVE